MEILLLDQVLQALQAIQLLNEFLGSDLMFLF